MLDKLKFKRLNDDAVLPTRGSVNAAGLDLYSRETCWLWPHIVRVVSTGISAAIPIGYYGRVAPRSGLAVKHGLDVLAGVIDSDYRGEICVALISHHDTSYQVQKGDKIAQLIIEKIEVPEPEWVEELDETVRGTAGFGSTGRS